MGERTGKRRTGLVGHSHRAATALATVLAVGGVAWLVWTGAGASDDAAATAAATTRTAAGDTTSPTPAPPDPSATAPPSGVAAADDDRAGSRPIRLVYEARTNNGDEREVVVAVEPGRWSIRDGDSWQGRIGSEMVFCMRGRDCQRRDVDGVSGTPGPPYFGFDAVAGVDHERRTIAGRPGLCAVVEVVDTTTCFDPDLEILLLLDPGDMEPGPFETTRLVLVDVGRPTDADFHEPSS